MTDVELDQAEATLVAHISGVLRAQLPEGWGYALLMFPPDGACVYVSNTDAEYVAPRLIELVKGMVLPEVSCT